jgi:hypothetical protein
MLIIILEIGENLIAIAYSQEIEQLLFYCDVVLAGYVCYGLIRSVYTYQSITLSLLLKFLCRIYLINYKF